jgi:hypothetical protein
MELPKVGPIRPIQLDGGRRQIKCVRFKFDNNLKFAWRVGTRTHCGSNLSRSSASTRKANSRFLTFMKKMMTRAVYNERNLPVKLHINDLIDMWHQQKGRCALTGVRMSHTQSHAIPDAAARNVSLDRIDPSGGYVPENLQLVCVVANTMKWNCTNEEFIHWCRHVVRKADGLEPLDDKKYETLRAMELDTALFL